MITAPADALQREGDSIVGPEGPQGFPGKNPSKAELQNFVQDIVVAVLKRVGVVE